MMAMRKRATDKGKTSGKAAASKPARSPKDRTKGGDEALVVSSTRAVKALPVNPGKPGVPSPKPPGNPFPGPGPISKKVEVVRVNPIFERIQARFNSISMERKVAAIHELKKLERMRGAARLEQMVKLGTMWEILRSDMDIGHARDHWLTSYFEGAAADVLFQGMRLAMEKSVETGAPMVVYWVAGPEKDLKTAVAVSPYQVTVMVVTPPKPAVDTKVRVRETRDPIWVVQCRDGKIEESQVVQTALV